MIHSQGDGPTTEKKNPDLRAVIDATPTGIVIFGQDGTVVCANPKANQLFGIDHALMNGCKCGDICGCAHRHESQDGCGFSTSCSTCPLRLALEKVLGNQSALQQGEVQLYRDPGHPPMWLRFTVSRLTLQTATAALLAVDDITTHKHEDAHEASIRRIMLATRKVGQLIRKTTDPGTLIRQACRHLIETQAFLNAWIALVDPAGTRLRGVASAGTEESLATIQSMLDDGQFPPCMQEALTRLPLVAVDDPPMACPRCSLAPICTGHAGFIARLAFKHRRFGVLAVAVPAALTADSDARDLIRGLADDLAFALYKHEADARQHLLKRIVATTPHPIAFLSTDFRYRTVNADYGKRWSTTRAQVVGRPVADLYGEAPFNAEIAPRLHRCLEGETVRYPLEIDFPAAGKRWMEMEYVPYRDERGRIAGIIAHGQDITDRKAAEGALASSERLKTLVLNAASEGILYYDADMQLLWANTAACDFLSLPLKKLVGKHCYQIWHGLDTPCPNCPLELARETRSVQEGEVETPDGRHWHLRGHPIHDDAGTLVAMVAFTRDITAEKKMDADREAAEADRKNLQQQIVQAQKMESIGNLAGGIAHDFNNILFPIIGLSEMMLEDLPPDRPERESVEQILKAGQRGGELVRQILAFSRQTENKILPVRVQQILKEVLKLARSTIPVDIVINDRIRNDCGMVLADPTQLHQIAMNLLTNAYHAVEATGGEITMELRETDWGNKDLVGTALEPGRYAMLTVTDTGCGIPPEVKRKIFEPYFTTKEKGKGTGLGLAVVYGIVKEHHGDIKVTSQPGKGSAFTIFLPIMQSLFDSMPQDGPPAAPPPGKERILLVDDEEAIVKMESKLLQRLGYHIAARTSSTEALAAFRAKPMAFDLIITDMTMPNMTGDQLARELIAIRPDIPIIICTGFSERIDRQKAEQIGIKGFLMKPVVQADMARTIRQALDGGTTAAG